MDKLFYDYEEAKSFIGGCYELHYCAKKLPVVDLQEGKGFDYNNAELAEQGLYTLFCPNDSFKGFEYYYGEIFKNEYMIKKMKNDGDYQVAFFDPYGINYYTPDEAKRILKNLNGKDLPEVDIIKSWLKTCIEKYNGFYILGI